MQTWNVLVFVAGAEWAPDSPLGLDRFQLDAAGQFRYENHVRGEMRSTTGTLSAEALAEIEAHLAEAAFPEVPPHDIPPGASLVEITVADSEATRTARMDRFAAMSFPGYRELLLRFERWTAWLRAGDTDAPPPGLNPAR